jgi:hypothetical protein
MLNRFTALCAAAAIVGMTAGRADAQLSFQVDSIQGFPGDVVNGQVDPATVAPNCNMTPEAVQESFLSVYDYFNDLANAVPYFGDFDPNNGLPLPETYPQASYYFLAITSFAVAFNFSDAAQLVLDRSFVMTFADIATQTPIGTLGSFDPVTGVGSVVVPDITPGLWAVAASCIQPNVARIPDAVDAGAAILEAAGVPVPLPPDYDLLAAVTQYGPALLPPMMGPKAFGAALYTILGPSPIDLDQATAWRTRSKAARITLKGTLRTGQFGSRDALAPVQDFSFTVTDGLDLDHSVEVPASDCAVNAKGVITCRNAARTVKITFRPQPATPGAYSFKIELTKLDFGAPQAGPLTLEMQYGIPRQGVASSCKVNEIKLACRG